MPATPIKPLITDAGLAAAIAAQGTGLTLQITHVQIGTGAYALDQTPGSPDFQRIALVAPVEKNVIAGGYRDSNRFRVDVLFSPWTGAPATWGVSEIGFWAGDPDAGGVLFALWAQPTVFAQRNMLTYLATFNLVLQRVASDAVSVVIDPDLALALALVSDHEAAQNPHPRYRKHQFASTVQCDVDTVLTAVQAAGNLVTIGGTGAIVTLPPSADMIVGETVTVIVQGVNGVVARNGADTISMGGSLGLTSLTMSASDGCELTYSGGGKWVVSGGSVLTQRTGEVAIVLGTTPKAGTIKANGALLPRASYARLWAFAQASGNLSTSEINWANGESGKFGPGDGATTFRVPDLRGYSLRMLDDGRGVDGGRGIGTQQADQLLIHAHGVNDPTHAHGVVDPTHAHGVTDPTHSHPTGTEGAGAPNGASLASVGYGAAGSTGAAATGISINGAATGIGIQGAGTGITIQNSGGGNEVRVKTIAALACIYY